MNQIVSRKCCFAAGYLLGILDGIEPVTPHQYDNCCTMPALYVPLRVSELKKRGLIKPSMEELIATLMCDIDVADIKHQSNEEGWGAFAHGYYTKKNTPYKNLYENE